MKRSLLAGMAVLFVLMVQAQLRWDGGGGSSRWMDPLNWDEDRIPEAEDTVILDHQYLSGHYRVVLPDGDSSVLVAALIISPFFPDSIYVVLPATNWAVVGFQALASSNALVIGRGAVFLNQSGAASGTPVSVSGTGFVRIENGGHYIHNTERGHTTGLVSRLSTAVGTETGIFEFDVPGTSAYTVSVSNRVYGELRFSANASGNNKTYTGAGVNPFIVRGNFRIGSGAVFSYGSNVATLRMEANCQIDSGGRFNISNGTRASMVQLLGNLYLNGTVQHTGTAEGSVFECSGNQIQHIYGSGTLQGDFIFRVNTNAELQVHRDLNLPGDLDLLSGILRVAEGQVLTMGATGLLLGYSEISFIDGSIRKAGAASFVFPTGQGGIYAPLRLGGEGNSTDTIQVRYVRSNPLSIPGMNGQLDAGVDHLSFVEYWELAANPLALPRPISLFAGATSFVRDTSSLVLMLYGASGWQSMGRSFFEETVIAGPWVQGWAHSMDSLHDFTFLTFGSTASVAINPLPVRILNFQAVRVAGLKALFNWMLAEPVSMGTRMALERFGGPGWLPLWDTVFTAPVNQRQFRVAGIPVPGYSSRYRMRVLEPGLGVHYSREVQLQSLQVDDQALLFPNPASGSVSLRFRGRGELLQIRINSAMGRLADSRSLPTIEGRFDYRLNLDQLAPGTYLVEIWSEGRFLQRLPLVRL